MKVACPKPLVSRKYMIDEIEKPPKIAMDHFMCFLYWNVNTTRDTHMATIPTIKAIATERKMAMITCRTLSVLLLCLQRVQTSLKPLYLSAYPKC